MASELNLNVATPGRGSRDPRRSPEKREVKPKPLEMPVLKPLPVSIAFDMRNIQAISEIKSEIGYARAWIRLSLEKKVLSRHLKALLADDELLRGFYKRTAFLRSEDEREHFLLHLLSLNTADYYCFTNTYVNIVLPYRMVIFPSKRFSISTTTANVWTSVSGTLGEMGPISVPKNTLEFMFQHKNLGLVTNMHIGHDNSGVSPKWMIDYVLIRNEVTGHCVKFPCGRWLGRDIDDGSTERLLVGEPYIDGEECPADTRLKTPTRARSPSVPRKPYESRLTPSEIQEGLSDTVNKIVKYFFQSEKDRGSLTVLLCGDNGLVSALEQVFLFGFKSSRVFGKNIYLWDYFVKVQEVFGRKVTNEDFELIIVNDDSSESSEHVVNVSLYCELIRKISFYASSLGKDGKFQLFICLCAREHLLPRLPQIMANLDITREMYDDHSFLRNPDLLQDMVQVVLALDDYDIILKHSLTKGID
ncbi:DENN domain-containing protein 5B [Orchesella cincta]|uniref:DENN domain-containing protein 5B n=1 Tax=Orchesella cincta TaxID=48709 RepID=A0A1D2MA41_ORCCI|nr:DENN domain-containing protein 5B [Orchesella cincta]